MAPLKGELSSEARLRGFPKLASANAADFFREIIFVKTSQNFSEKIGANAEKRIDNMVSIL